jgi:serine O-acetyltransferase
MSPERLWLLSIALRRRGHRRLAIAVKTLNSVLFHNSLAPGAEVSPDVTLGHHGFGVMIHSNVVIGRRVKIWHNVTIAVRSRSAWRSERGMIVIEDDVRLGAGAIVMSPREGSLTIGRGARIGAGAIVSQDVPAGATVTAMPSRVRSPAGELDGDPDG